MSGDGRGCSTRFRERDIWCPIALRRRPTKEQKCTAKPPVGNGRRKVSDSVGDVLIIAYLLPPPGSSSGLLRDSGGLSVPLNRGIPLRPLSARSCSQCGDDAVAGPQEGGEPGGQCARWQGI